MKLEIERILEEYSMIIIDFIGQFSKDNPIIICILSPFLLAIVVLSCLGLFSFLFDIVYYIVKYFGKLLWDTK